MKNIFIIAFAIFTANANAQVIIGDAVGTAANTEKASVLLEFATAQNKGIIVPAVRSKTAVTHTPGTFLLDATDPTKARMKFYSAKDASVDGGWEDLSGQDADVSSFLADQPLTTAASDQGKAVIGAQTSSAEGVLVLESQTKAMILPIVSDYTDIKNPSPGMMALQKPGSDATKYRLIVFNGSKWSFWKP